MVSLFISLALLLLVLSIAMASDQSPLQDFCVADLNSQVFMNGYACKDPISTNANDFMFSGLQIVGNTSNAFGFKVTPVSVTQLPGLNTLGISMSRIDFAPFGISPPHTHLRASEILTVLESSLEVGFVNSNPENIHISHKVLQKGDVFVFPKNLVHYQKNNGNTNAVAISAFNSEHPGVILVASAVFGAKPDLSTDILAKAFQTSDDVIDNIKLKF